MKTAKDKMICDNCGREAQVNTDYAYCPYCGFTYRNILLEEKIEINQEITKGHSDGLSQ